MNEFILFIKLCQAVKAWIFYFNKVKENPSQMGASLVKKICQRKSWPYNKLLTKLLVNLERELSCGLAVPKLPKMSQSCRRVLLLLILHSDVVDFQRYKWRFFVRPFSYFAINILFYKAYNFLNYKRFDCLPVWFYIGCLFYFDDLKMEIVPVFFSHWYNLK